MDLFAENAVIPSTHAWWRLVDDLDRHLSDPIALDHVASVATEIPEGFRLLRM